MPSVLRLPRPPRLRRALAVLVPALLVPTLVACGGTKSGYGDKTVSGFSGVSISGEVGKEPKLDWKADIAYPKSTQVKTLVKGSGAAVEAGTSVYANFYVGNASTTPDKWNYTSLTDAPTGMEMDASMGPAYKKLLEGAHIGDRREAIARASDVVGAQGNPTYDIGNHDTLVLVVDILKAGPDKTPHDVPQAQLPKLKLGKDKKPTGFDFSGVKKPSADGKLLRSVVKEGTGTTVTTDMTLTVNYLGMVYDGKKPFDESYTKKPAQFALTGVVEGWTYGLNGLKVGSRVLLEIPPALGYADKAQSGIPANSTLFFVVDIIKAEATPASDGASTGTTGQ